MAKLDQFQRTVLANQYRILQKLEALQKGGPKGDWDLKLEALERGYEAEYPLEKGDPVTDAECEEVTEVLRLYRALRQGFARLSDADKKGIDEEKLKFEGWDLNDPVEGRFIGYVDHLAKLNQFKGSNNQENDEGNSHSENREWYRRMVKARKQSADPAELTRDDILRILSA